MIKSPKKSPFTNDRPVYLYDRVRDDIFEGCQSKEPTTIVPSITTIFLLQLQASIIKLVTMLPPKKSQGTTTSFLEAYAPLCLIRQSMRWVLLLGLLLLDNVARLLNVEDEMNQLTNSKKSIKNEQQVYKRKSFFRPASLSSLSSLSSSSNENTTAIMKQRYNNNHSYGLSGATLPVATPIPRCSRPCCTTPDPPDVSLYPSPPPSSPLSSSYNSQGPEVPRRVREKCISFPSSYKQQISSHEKSPALPPTQRTGCHTRSISTNSIKNLSNNKKTSPNSTLRRTATAQRETHIANQPRNTVLKETSAWTNKKHSHPYHSATSSVASSSGSSCEYVRPSMKKTRSSTTTAENIQRKERIQKPYERCCQACISSQHN